MNLVSRPRSACKSLFWGLVVGWLVYFLGSTLVGICYFFSDLSDSILPWLVYLIWLISVLVSSTITGSGAGSNGWLWGILAGGLLFILLLIKMSLISQLPAWDSVLLKLIIGLLGGAMGGILGVGRA